MTRPFVEKVVGTIDQPRQVDLVIIGGGIIGCSAALWAVEQGLRVAVVEKGRIAGEQSSRNWGWVRRMGRAVSEYPLGIESLRLWDTLGARTGRDVGFRRTGIIYGARSDREKRFLDTAQADAARFGLRTIRLDQAALAQRFPGSVLRDTEGLMAVDDGRAEPALTTPAIAQAVQAAGGAVLTGCAVRGVETKAGRLSAVVTERGVIGCDAAIVAAGAWSRLFLGNLGINIPQTRVRASVLRTAPVAGGPEHSLGNGAFGIRPRMDGGYTISQRGRARVQMTLDAVRQIPQFLPSIWHNRAELGFTLDQSLIDGLRTPRHWSNDEQTPFERCRVLEPAPQDASLNAALRDVGKVFPALQNAQIAESWGAIIDATPDGVPIIDPAEALPGLVIATGFSGHGFGLGPGAGQLAAELATGADTLVDPAPFRLARFHR